MKYPIGIQSFEQIVEEGYVYVDKTALVYDLVQNGMIYFLCRPRRFGKSLLVSTLKCYFEGRKELFQGLAMEKLETEWKQYPVFHLDFNGIDFTKAEMLEKILTGFIRKQETIWGRDEFAEGLGNRFAAVLKTAHEKTGLRAIVLIDEYDKPLLDVLDLDLHVTINGEKRRLEDRNREILGSFYSTFKAANEDLRFVLLTGVTKFSQASVFSGFNQPNDISMDDHYEALCGITEKELYTVFDEPIQAMAQRYKVTVDEMKQELKRKYDGYHFAPNMLDIYNPFSILNALSKHLLSNFWFNSDTPTYQLRPLNHFKENINKLAGKFYLPNSFMGYLPDEESLLPLIYQSGYLTIKDWNMNMNSYLLDLPNDEVKQELLSADQLQTKE